MIEVVKPEEAISLCYFDVEYACEYTNFHASVEWDEYKQRTEYKRRKESLQ
eukprot:TRINITY_DN13336_c0_g1_i1.p3 TRINITY_DN13336_c0_g1~~TRINITY_DN13336_c0_g1_i1.p3  ORF type:complete len:51 (-),score=5.67 TRINITY_DN13336_c0_g1_i1:81-233(-)